MGARTTAEEALGKRVVAGCNVAQTLQAVEHGLDAAWASVATRIVSNQFAGRVAAWDAGRETTLLGERTNQSAS